MTTRRDPDELPGLHHYRRALERGLPRWDGRSPALKAKQAAAGVTNLSGKSARRAESSAADKEAKRALARIEALQGEMSAVIDRMRRREEDAERRLENARRETAKLRLECMEAKALLHTAGLMEPCASVASIIAETARLYGIKPTDITGCRRQKRVMLARREAMAIAYLRRPDLSLPALGRIFRKDHTTVLHALRKAGVYAEQTR